MADKNANLKELQQEVEILNKKVKSLGKGDAGKAVNYTELLALVRKASKFACW